MNPFDSDIETPESLQAALEVRREENPQLYENSPLCGSPADTDWQENPDRLYGSQPPNLAILKESPRHRMAIFLKAQSLSNREIALRLGFSEAWVCQILRQPWAQERLLKEIQESGRDAVTELLRGAAVDCVMTQISIHSDPKVPPAARNAAANSLLDRLYGKPTQRVETFNTNTTVESVASLDEKLAALEKEEARLRGRTTSTGSGTTHCTEPQGAALTP